MTRKLHGALVASLSLIALSFATDEATARSGAAPGGAHARGFVGPRVAPSLRHHHPGNRAGAFWPGWGGYFYDPSMNGQAAVDFAQPPESREMRHTYTYDVPWDWAHRYPPAVTPSDRPYVSNCHAETVTVPGRGGTEQAVNIMRCY
jgi:hypothetical protein